MLVAFDDGVKSEPSPPSTQCWMSLSLCCNFCILLFMLNKSLDIAGPFMLFIPSKNSSVWIMPSPESSRWNSRSHSFRSTSNKSLLNGYRHEKWEPLPNTSHPSLGTVDCCASWTFVGATYHPPSLPQHNTHHTSKETSRN